MIGESENLWKRGIKDQNGRQIREISDNSSQQIWYLQKNEFNTIWWILCNLLNGFLSLFVLILGGGNPIGTVVGGSGSGNFPVLGVPGLHSNVFSSSPLLLKIYTSHFYISKDVKKLFIVLFFAMESTNEFLRFRLFYSLRTFSF